MLPGLRLPLGRRRIAPGAGVSFLLHAALILFLAFLSLSVAPAILIFIIASNFINKSIEGWFKPQVERPLDQALSVAQTYYANLERTDLPRLELPAVAPALGTVAAATGAAATGSGQGPGGGAGVGAGAGPGAGSALGPGTGDAGSYIFVAAPRMAILPPLASVPRSVAGRTYRVRFWVGAEGRVTRIEVDPPIPDADYGREFRQRMMAYQFYPARTRDGRSVASVVTVPVRIGN